ncbi:GntR family transcriptional regulator [Maritimibacter sp. DP1N21-5]|uniref:GntR family transcriptional regulator n=1 Tax=Maritimibacter sp. DP1N21-5 TaxID=2836867 RepID=UPI001C45AE68|nr:GntR family transcriptional regulator [Maritimibacter sp. DP1N21-5]MBV7407368.1 GntR family transcriptional regulator [Maritimibacter sp. DP1N21-5]
MAKTAGLTHAESVRLSLENDIFTGRLPPGASLDEEALARRFSVSRTPVREAMLQLIQSGLVEKKPRQGAIVTQIDLSDMIRLFEVMSELEGICAKFAARRMTPQERQALRKLHEQSVEAYEAGNHDKYYTLSRRFHLMVIEGTHNHELIETTNRLGIKLVPYRRFQLGYPGRSENNLKDHEAIMEAIVAGEYDQAAELFRKHTNVQGDVLAEYIAMGDREAKAVNAG